MLSFKYLIQARMGSTRFPGKIVFPFSNGKTLIEQVIFQILKSPNAQKKQICVLTTDLENESSLVSLLNKDSIVFFCGSEQNVFNRFRKYLESNPCDYFFRICSDNPFIDPGFIDHLVDQARLHPNADYLSYFSRYEGKPSILTHSGFFCELIKTASFMSIDESDLSPYEKEHVTPRLYQSGCFNTHYVPMPEEIDCGNIRTTIDTKGDFDAADKLISALGTSIECNSKTVVDLIEKLNLSEQMKQIIESNKK